MTIEVHVPDTDEKVTLQKVSLDVQFPVERQSAFSLMVDIFGEEKGKFIVSPEGGVPKDSYYKLISKLHTEPKDGSGAYIGEGEKQRKDTEEDTNRFWVVRNPEFLDELAAEGWTIFSEMSEWSDHQKKKHFVNTDKCFFRPTNVEEVARVIKSGEGPENYQNLLDQLEVIKPFMGDTVYTGFRKSWPGGEMMLVGETSFPGIHLQLDEFWNQFSRDSTPVIDLDAAVYLGGSEYAQFPEGWNEQIKGRVGGLINDKIGENRRAHCRNRDEKSFSVHYDDRGETIQSPAELEKRLNQMKEWVEYGERAAALEIDEIKKSREAVYEDRKNRLGIPPEKRIILP